MNSRSHVVFSVNHEKFEISGNDAFQTLADFLRYQAGLTGTKIVCAEGDCGACTVLVGHIFEKNADKLKYRIINSCIVPLYLLDCHHIITVEGVKHKNSLHAVQKAMVDFQGAQCGYCTPGIVCSLASCAEEALVCGKQITRKKAANFLTGNLCRCTGYLPILEAATHLDLTNEIPLSQRYHDDSRNLEFEKLSRIPARIPTELGTVFIPSTLQSALEHKSRHPHAKISGGNTDLGVQVNKGRIQLNDTVSLQNIPDLYSIRQLDSQVYVGSRVTLTQLEEFLESRFPEAARLMRVFASPQIKNQGTLVGNIINASPIADTIPSLMISDAVIHTQTATSKREIPITEFYLGYKKLDLKPEELVTGVSFPLPKTPLLSKLYKVSLRKDLDISAVTFAASVQIDKGMVTDLKISYGGVGPVVLRLRDLEKAWLQKPFLRKTFEEMANTLPQYLSPISDLRASKEYRILLCKNLLLRFYDEISSEGRK